ncbi:KLH26-like protein [Mya arenaria]|uniref:KLH26-like protein n=1 Tax=Mya arenaria TaxID=6604 RepID=A0ABY7EU90_MYAAR|nr:kelch-like protein 26 [Mya arenaria]XP_052816120.1 kelch-like protein 26 [Mya arenaria]WAR12865.1 KLH26-like protein [Mya arenaria]
MPVSPRKRPSVREDINPGPSNAGALVAKNHSIKLMRGLQEFHKEETFCDYVLVAESQTFKVHRVVMASCSDYFKVMLTGEMKESREGQVDLKGVSAKGLKVVIDFAYTGIMGLTVENVEEVLSAATHLQVTDAVELCSKYIESSLTIENCVDVLNLAELYSLHATYKKAQLFMLEQFEMMAKSGQYQKLNDRQLAQLLEDNRLQIASEYHLFELVVRWMKGKKDRDQFVAALMKNVRLPLLSGEELVEKVSTVPLMRENNECHELLTEAKDYHIVVSKQPLLQSKRTQVRASEKCLVMCHRENLEYFNLSNMHHGFLRDATIQLYHPAVVVVDNFMYACGGKYDFNENNEIATARCFRYDPRFDTWYELTSMNEARKDFVLLADDKNLYAVAGQDENLVMCTVEMFDIASNEWEVKASMNHSVYGHAGAVCDGKLYISGGQKFDGCCSDLEMYDPRMDLWEKRSPMNNARLNHNMVTVNFRIFSMCGNIEDSMGFPVPVITIEYYTPSKDQWTVCTKTMNIREAGACLIDDKIYIVGGINGEHYYSDIVQSFTPATEQLKIVEKFSTRLHGRACCVLTLPQYL